MLLVWIRLCSKGWARLKWYIKFMVLPVSRRGRRSCIICRRHWSDYGQTYNIQKNCHTGELTFPLLFTISLARCGTHFLLMKRNPADQHETTIWRNQKDTVTWLAVSVSLPTLLGYQRASAFVNATKLASPNLCFLPTKNIKYWTFYRTHFLLISITCLSRYISLSFYRPALGWMLFWKQHIF